MPLLRELPGWLEPDEVDRPIVTYGVPVPTAGHLELTFHSRVKGQLLFSQRGALSCEAEGGLWIVPPQSAIWIPGGKARALRAKGMLEGYTVFVHPAAGANLPAQCCALAVTPLLREMIIRAASFPVDYPDGGREERLVALLLDEISVARVERLHLPMPNDVRLRAIVAEMLDNPAKMRKMSDWARHIGMSERTMARILSRETGMGFRRWRQQLAVLLAVEWLARGSPIQQVAADLGYESAPSFVTMFRKALGTPPRRYMSRRSQRH